MTAFTIRVTDNMAHRLNQITQKPDRSCSYMAAQVSEDFVSREEWQLAEIEAGLLETTTANSPVTTTWYSWSVIWQDDISVMTQRRVRWTERALRRLDEIGDDIERDDPDAAAGALARLIASVDMLAELPTTGRIGRITGTREVVLSDIPHIIPYRVRRDIEIITAMHASQKRPKRL